MLALNPSLDVSQYAHTAWKIGDGFPNGVIRALAQTSDGYLWLGTEFGLRRFDGVRAVPWEPPGPEHLPTTDIRSLQGGRDGRLWIGTFTGLVSWKDGKLTRYPELDGQVIEALLEDRQGTIWVAGWSPSTGRLCRIQSDRMQCYGQDGRFGSGVTPLYEDGGGGLWAGAMNGLWRWTPGQPQLYPMPNPALRMYALIASDDGGILIAKHSGMTKLKNGRFEAYALPPEFQPHRLLRDRKGSLWIGAVIDKGLLHVHEGRTDLYRRADGLTSDSVNSIFEDREGNIWVATLDGLDRFRDFAIPTFSAPQGLSSRGVFSVVAANDTSLWLAASNGLNHWRNREITVYRNEHLPGLKAGSMGTVREVVDSGLPGKLAETLFQDSLGRVWVGMQSGIAVFYSGRFIPIRSVPLGVVYGFVEDNAGNVWVSHQEGLFRLFQQQVVERIPWTQLERGEPATSLMYDAATDGLWLGFRDGGVAYFKDGRIRASFGTAEGLGQGMVRNFYADRNKAIWTATDGGLSRIADGRVLTLTSQNGLPCDLVHWMREDDAHSVWLYLACGLARIDRSELDAWVAHPKQAIHPTIFDSSDGVSSHRYTGGYGSTVARTGDGKFWFLPVGGISVIDPKNLASNELRPPVHIESIIADDQSYEIKPGMRLRPNVRNLRIDFTALCLVAAEEIHFKYMLEGQNRNWHEVINERHATYTNLSPKKYRFHVTASNNSGLWNETGDTLEFSIDPAWNQTSWFYASCVAVFLAILWGLYRLRLYQIRREFSAELDGRVDERMRVARELHDTMLQSFQAALIQMQAARNIFSRRPEKTGESLDRAIKTAAGAIADGRGAIQGLRLHPSGGGDLAELLTTAGQELARSEEPGNPPVFGVTVEGARRDLAPLIQDEVYRIGRELLRNSFRHSQAERIEAEIRYESGQLCLHVRDDGKGIDPEILKAGGSDGHFGLPGMRERANQFGGKLEFWSEAGAGTEAVLTIPGAAAYAAFDGRFSFLRRKKAGA